MCMILSIKGNVFGVEPPTSLTLRSPRPSRACRQHRDQHPQAAKLETGAEIKVPLFINIGDKIQIDTRTGEYIGRAK